jgi:hypothetical protein
MRMNARSIRVEMEVGESSGIFERRHLRLFRRRTSLRIAGVTTENRTEYKAD